MVQSSTRISASSTLNRVAAWFMQHWLLVLNVLMGFYVLTPFAAPILMEDGLSRQAHLIYLIYSTQCHQLPERSYFLFGQNATYSIGDINAARGSSDPLTLRQFIGNAEMGYKVAWSDRMISLYTSIWFGGLLYALLRRRLTPLPLRLLVVLLIPIVLDGGSHFIADLQGIGQGFRDTNTWLRAFTGGIFPTSFYAGDGLGSFNSLMRMWTGALSGIALAWTIFPRIDRLM